MGVDGTTPLVAATYHRHPAIVRMLLDAGADIEKDADWLLGQVLQGAPCRAGSGKWRTQKDPKLGGTTSASKV